MLVSAILVEYSTLHQPCGASDGSERDVHVVLNRGQSLSGLITALNPNPPHYSLPRGRSSSRARICVVLVSHELVLTLTVS